MKKDMQHLVKTRIDAQFCFSEAVKATKLNLQCGDKKMRDGQRDLLMKQSCEMASTLNLDSKIEND